MLCKLLLIFIFSNAITVYINGQTFNGNPDVSGGGTVV
jgi:hypothetical protein